MKNPKGLIITIIIIALPIVWLCIQLNTINNTYNTSGDDYSNTEELITEIINNEVNNATENSNPEGNSENSGDNGSSIYGNPTSKLIEGAKINVDSCSIYEEPDESSRIVASAFKDITVTVQDYEFGWSNIKSDDFTGWIKSEYVTRPGEGSENSLTSAVGHKGIVTASTLNVRSDADSNASLIDQLEKDEEVNVIGANENETWLQIQYGTKSGWVSAKYLNIKY
jgi:uncharacterized protein YraI